MKRAGDSVQSGEPTPAVAWFAIASPPRSFNRASGRGKDVEALFL